MLFQTGDLPAAKSQLQWVADRAKDDAVRDVARLRLAGVLLKLFDQAGLRTIKLKQTKRQLASQIGTAFYFLFFLVIIPVLGLIETPKPVPNSISEAVLAKSKAH